MTCSNAYKLFSWGWGGTERKPHVARGAMKFCLSRRQYNTESHHESLFGFIGNVFPNFIWELHLVLLVVSFLHQDLNPCSGLQYCCFIGHFNPHVALVFILASTLTVLLILITFSTEILLLELGGSQFVPVH